MKSLIKFILCTLAIIGLVSVNSHAKTTADALTVAKLNQLNKLHDLVLSPNGEAMIYGLKKGTESGNNHLYHHVIADE